MSEFPHDTFAKDYLTERREGDVWFEQDPQMSLKMQRQRLGLLGQLLSHDALIEVFRNDEEKLIMN